MNKLLSRNEFRRQVFNRDNHKCIVCGLPAVDAHHIMERRLFTELTELGGYFLDNGASVCSNCHIKCEQTLISPYELWYTLDAKPVLPSHLYDDQLYDKWGNLILSNGSRLRGELFNDESVQKVLKSGGVLDCFVKYVKYPRTYHLPWSPGINSDDRMLELTSQFKNQRVVVTMKMDGENTTMYRDYIHARSVESKNHPSRNYIKSIWANIAHEIGDGYRICGENLYATHSIHYNNLKSYFYGFSIWNEKNECLSWDETKFYFQLLNIPTPEILFDGIYDEDYIRKINVWSNKGQEGYVLRIERQFPYSQFKNLVGKCVRPNHIMTTKHWMHGQPIVPNELAE